MMNGSVYSKKVIQKMVSNGIDVSKCTIGVLGITFKENRPDIRNSKIVEVVSEFKKWGVSVVVVTMGRPIGCQRSLRYFVK